jgi:hypothetical protein
MNTDTKHEPAPLPAQTPEQAARLLAIAERQGTLHTSNLEHLLGVGKELWDSDEEFAQFLQFIRESRTRG